MIQPLPAPLTPANCDLGGNGTLPVDISRFRHSALFRTADDAVFAAGFWLMCSAWQQTPAASLVNDDQALAYYARLGHVPRRWKRVRERALADWRLCSDGRLYHPDVASVALERWLELLLSEGRRTARRSGAVGHAARRRTLSDVAADIAAALALCSPYSRAPVLRRARQWLKRHNAAEGTLRRKSAGRAALRLFSSKAGRA